MDITVGVRRPLDMLEFFIESFCSLVKDGFERDKIADRDTSYDLLQ